jgi:hypothetical protein
LVNVNAAPLAAIILVNWDDAYRGAFAGQVALPEFRGSRLLENTSLASVLTVGLSFLDFISAVSLFQTIKDGGKLFY